MAKRTFLVDIDLARNQLLNAKLQNLTVHPSVTAGVDNGFTYWNTTDVTAYSYSGVGTTWLDLGSVGPTNIGYTASTRVLTSSTGTGFTFPLADATNPGLLTASHFILLGNTSGANSGDNSPNSLYSGLVSNVPTALSVGTVGINTVGIDSDGSSDDVIIPAATVSTAGLLTTAKWGEIVANTGKTSNIATQLSTGTVNATSYGITSDGGANDIILAQATTVLAGVLSAAKWNEIVANTAKLTANTANVNAAGAVMNSDTSTAAMDFVIDEDNMVSDSATKTPTQQSVKAYVDGSIATADAFVVKGGIDCSTNPNYPAADAGWAYRVTAAGKIGGVSGRVVEVGDLIICFTDGTASGTQAAVGSEWIVEQNNVEASSETVAGYVRLATAGETAAGTGGDIAVKPSHLITQLNLKANLASPTFSGTPNLPTGTIGVTQSLGNNTTALATTAFVFSGLALKSNIASPTFTGVPLAPTAAVNTSNTQIATTAFVNAEIANDAVVKSSFTAVNDFIVGAGAGSYAKKTLAETKTILGITNATNKYAATFGNGTLTTFSILQTTHLLGIDVQVQTKLISSGALVECEILINGSGDITINTNTPVSLSNLRVVVIG